MSEKMPALNPPGPLRLDQKRDHDPERNISIWDEQDPLSVLGMVPKAVATAFGDIYHERTELFNLDEQELYRRLRANNKTPTATDNRLRIKFWHEYDRAQASKGSNRMEIKTVIAGICSKDLFYREYIHNPEKVAWLLCPPTNYIVKATEALEFGLEQLREILSANHFDAGGNLNPRVADIKLKIFKIIDDRVNGMAVQRTEEKSVHAHLHASTSDRGTIGRLVEQVSDVDLAQELAELERKNRLAQHLPEHRDEVDDAVLLSMTDVTKVSDDSVSD